MNMLEPGQELHGFNHQFLRDMTLEELRTRATRLREENRAFHLDQQIVRGKFCVIQKDREWLAQWLTTNVLIPLHTADDNRRALNRIDMELGVRIGWWEDWDETGPIDFPKTFRMGQFGEKPLMAHVVHALGIFPSVTQARKNGFDKPLGLGDHVFTKKKIRARVIE